MGFLSFMHVAMATQRVATEDAKAQHEKRAPPIVVHCSAGVGRTGVLCGIDICLQRAKEIGHFDVPATVVHMRRDRPGSVQTVLQYGFIYDAVLLAYQKAHAATIPSQEAKDKELYVPTPPPAQSQQVKLARNSMPASVHYTGPVAAAATPAPKPSIPAAAVAATPAVIAAPVAMSTPAPAPAPPAPARVPEVPARVPEVPAALAPAVVALPPAPKPVAATPVMPTMAALIAETTPEAAGPLSANEMSILSELGGGDGPTDPAELVRLLRALE